MIILKGFHNEDAKVKEKMKLTSNHVTVGVKQEVNEVNIPGYKGWVNPKTGKTQIIQGHRPYHVQMIVKNPRFYGLTEKLIMNHLIETYEELDSPTPEEDAKFAMDELKSGDETSTTALNSWQWIEAGFVLLRVSTLRFQEEKNSTTENCEKSCS